MGKYDNFNEEGEVFYFEVFVIVLFGIVGLGNIVGVFIVISLGGLGVVFWMIIVGFLGMSIKFMECILV